MNPFRESVVTSPWESPRVDVAEIHGGVFDQCLIGIEQVRGSGHSAGLLIHGEAGSGKTHLLGRLRARLAPLDPPATYRDECLFVWVRLQTTPRMIWRTLRRTLVEDWFRPIGGKHSQFKRILFHRLAEKRPAEWDLEPWYEYMLEEHPDELTELVDRIATEIHLDRNTAVAFTHIAFDRHTRDLRAWLAGASLPQAALDRMDLAQDEGNDEEREDQARQVVLMLCRLAGNGLPIVLSFDQVEALQAAPRDPEALHAFGQVISTLHDGDATNVLALSCVQSAFATELKDHARQADYARMTSLGALSLDPLDRAQAQRLIAARREKSDNGIEVAAACGTWPLPAPEFDHLFVHGAVSPRRLLTVCAERFETQAGLPQLPSADRITVFLEEQWQTVLQSASADGPEKTDVIIEHGLPMLMNIIDPGMRLASDPRLKDLALLFETATGRIGIAICARSDTNSLAAQLKRLKAQLASQRLDRLVLLQDERVPISTGAKIARQHLAELEQQQAVVVRPSVGVLAELDTLRQLLSDAKSGDLACQGETISPQVVVQWLAGRLPTDLVAFANEVLGEITGSPASNSVTTVEPLSA